MQKTAVGHDTPFSSLSCAPRFGLPSTLQLSDCALAITGLASRTSPAGQTPSKRRNQSTPEDLLAPTIHPFSTQTAGSLVAVEARSQDLKCTSGSRDRSLSAPRSLRPGSAMTRAQRGGP